MVSLKNVSNHKHGASLKSEAVRNNTYIRHVICGRRYIPKEETETFTVKGLTVCTINPTSKYIIQNTYKAVHRKIADEQTFLRNTISTLLVRS